MELTAEAVFGITAGTVWEALNKNGPSSVADIAKTTGLKREMIFGALGWLGREDKVSIEKGERAIVYSLKQ